MKRISRNFILLVAIVVGGVAFAQKPEKIYSISIVQKSNDYYVKQMELWGKELQKDSLNADAWLNYYKTHRYIRMEEEKSDSTGTKRPERMKSVVDMMEKYIPESYEFNFVKYFNGGNDLGLYPYLEKAHKIQPDRAEHYDDMVTYHECMGNKTMRDEFILKLYHSNTMSPGMLQYNYNVLSGLEKNAILLTSGDNDTYPAWLVQQGKNFRKDVRVLNVHLLIIDTYRDRVFEELGVPPLKLKALESYEDMKAMHDTLVEHLSKNTANRPVYLGVTASHGSWANHIKDKLYLTGLAYLYCESDIDNIAFLKKNFERVFLLDYLKTTFYSDISEDMVRLINTNYIIPLVNLSEHYKHSGDDAKSNEYKALARMLAKGSKNHEEYWNKYLDEI